MRTIIQNLSLVLLLLSSVALAAQPGGRGNSRTPEQRAEQQTAAMVEQLTLSKAQADKIQEVHLKYAKQMQEAWGKADGDREAMREAMRTLRTEQDKELQVMVTDTQWKQWTTYRAEKRAEQRAKRGSFGRGGKPNPEQKTVPGEDGDKKSKKKKKEKKKDKEKGSDTESNQ